MHDVIESTFKVQQISKMGIIGADQHNGANPWTLARVR
jgi:hypothetical protein